MAALQPACLRACPHCGLIQTQPPIPPRCIARCPRCLARLPDPNSRTTLAWPAALALAALILYPISMSLPVLEITKLGHSRETTIWSGVVQLYTDGHAIIGTIVLVCSIVVPLAKIAGIFTLCISAGRDTFFNRRHQSLTYRAIDWIGRWGMIDVLLVAILIAAVKLGDWLNVHPGPGVLAFAAVVILSLLSSITFDPQSIWTNTEAASPATGVGGQPSSAA